MLIDRLLRFAFVARTREQSLGEVDSLMYARRALQAFVRLLAG